MSFTQKPDLNILQGSLLAKGNANTYSPNSGIYAFPLTVGKTWEAKANFATSTGRTGSYKLDAKVVGWEKVKVPAGEFDTLKITESGFYQSANEAGTRTGTGRMQITIWYAPAVGGMVKTQYEDTNWGGSLYNKYTLELLGYSLSDKRSEGSGAN